MPQKLILFVDCSNFYHTLKDNGVNPCAVDCNKFFEDITRKQNPTVRFYDAAKKSQDGMRQYANQQYFHARLKNNPNLTIHLGRLQLNKNLNPKNRKLIIDTLGFCGSCKSKINDLLFALGVLKKHKEKGVDVRLAVDLITVAEEDVYDTAILLSGDADLVPAVDFVVKKKNKRIINAYFNTSSGKELRDACSSCFLIKPERIKNSLKT